MKIMREILFRGKQSALPEWIEGFYFAVPAKNKVSSDTENIHLITPCDFDVSGSFANSSAIVIPETIGQYTGVTDTNGRKIFEGDIVWDSYDEDYGKVEWDNDMAKFIITYSTFTVDFDNVYGDELEIVGNVYDNPEHLE
jgi:uncharacterized phage protein (TIGR01671 family)